MYKLIAHRGDKESSKENTLAAFFDAIKKNYVGFECDVRMTKDDKFVIYHDPLYKGKLIKNYNYKQLKKDGFITLESVLNINTDKIIMIDIKDPFININLFNNILSKHRNKNIYVMSFYNNVIKRLFKVERKYKIGILNYVLNTSDDHFKYDFLCILNAFANAEIINQYKKDNKMLVIYGLKRKDIIDLYPYYIVD